MLGKKEMITAVSTLKKQIFRRDAIYRVLRYVYMLYRFGSFVIRWENGRGGSGGLKRIFFDFFA
jgi:hypothetical protein